MLGSDPDISARWALSAGLMQAALPLQAYAPPRGDEDKSWTDQRGSHRCPAHRWSPAARPVRGGARTARGGFGSRFTVTDAAPTAQPPDGAGQLNSGSSPGTDQQLRSLLADAMRQLPFEHRAVIYRAYYRGWTTTEIAANLKITEAAVKSRLHYGLRASRLALREMGVTA